ncbi:MAG: holo-ACP synthase [Candidatus Aminicenantes bacterium]|nr:holo-ACP synthase [Candidatus Aminicenantes bacterium]
MIKGIGTDIIDIVRIKNSIEKNKRFVEKIFTEKEIGYCEARMRREVHYAGRFAAKEAFFKAIGTGYRGGMGWREISIENDELGKPGIELSGRTRDFFKKKKFKNIHLSISHTREYAVSFVVID